MRTVSQVFPSMARPDRLLLAALLVAGAIALAACGNANGDDEKDGKDKSRPCRSRSLPPSAPRWPRSTPARHRWNPTARPS